jgi:D-serine deaminase-like pyridoxal phosphate-dependent protein
MHIVSSRHQRTKTHKSQFVGGLQVQAGAVALTVAKGGEAEVMGGVSSEVFIAYAHQIGTPAIGQGYRIGEATSRRVGIDSIDAADRISARAHEAGVNIDVMVDLDVGFQEPGFDPWQMRSVFPQP